MGGRHVVRVGAALLALLAAVAVLVVAPASPASAAPSNDAFNSAEILFGNTGSVNGTNVDATMQTLEPNHAAATQPNGRSVWYSFTPSTSGTLELETCGAASFDTTLAVYTGSAVGSLNPIASNDDLASCTLGRSRVSFAASSSTTYLIAVAGFQGASGSFTLTWQLGTPPANDAYANAATITGSSGSANGSTVLATREPGEPNVWQPDGFNPPQHTVWYRYTASAAGTLTVGTCTGTSVDTGLSVSTGSTFTGLTPVARNDDAAGCGSGSQSRVTFAATAATTYRIDVSSWEASGPFTLSWNLVPSGPPPPANDAIASPQAINGSTGTVDGTTEGATFEGTEPSHFPHGDDRSVWYSYTPSASGTLTLDTCATVTDTGIAVYTGTPSAASTPIASNDDDSDFGCASSPSPARVSLSVTSGTVYRVAVVTFSLEPEGGPFTLAWNLVPSGPTAPANDAIASAQLLTGSTGTASGTTAGATLEGTEPAHSPGGIGVNRTVWYRYVPTANGTLTLDTCASALDTAIFVYTGTPNGSSSTIAANDDGGGCPAATVPARVSFPVTSGTTYRFAVATYEGTAMAGGAFTLAWNLVPAGPTAPGNDAFANAQTITGATGSTNGTTVEATGQTGEPNHYNLATPTRSVWYSYTPATSGVLTVATCSAASFDTMLAAYTGAAVNVLTEQASNHDASGCPSNRSRLSLFVTAGTTYRIAVAGKAGATGTFTLDWTLVAGPARPANDAFASAQTLTGAGGSADGTTVSASFEPGEPRPFGYSALGPSVWYRWTAPAAGDATFETCSAASFDTMLGAHTGAAANALAEVAEGDDECATSRTRITFTATAGTTYRLQVTGGNGSTGTFTLAWNLEATGPGGPTFTDVATSHPFYADIEWMATEEISTGYQPGPTYRPGSPVTRAAMSAFMYRLAGSPSFTAPGDPTFGDVGTGHPFYDEIEWMASEDITTGTAASPKPLYKPSAAVSRGAMSAFMYRLAGEPTFSDPASATFADVNSSHPFFTEIEWMAAEDITTGTPGSPKPTYKPANAVSRGAMSAFMHRLADGPGVSL
jgi:hypothetical protein